MDSTSSQDASEGRHRRKKRRVTVSEPKEDGISTRQIAVLAFLALLVIAALVVIFSSYEVPVLRRR